MQKCGCVHETAKSTIRPPFSLLLIPPHTHCPFLISFPLCPSHHSKTSSPSLNLLLSMRPSKRPRRTLPTPWNKLMQWHSWHPMTRRSWRRSRWTGIASGTKHWYIVTFLAAGHLLTSIGRTIFTVPSPKARSTASPLDFPTSLCRKCAKPMHYTGTGKAKLQCTQSLARWKCKGRRRRRGRRRRPRGRQLQ